MAGPVISLTSSAQSSAAYKRRLAEVEKFCRWIECAEVVKGWKPWFLGAFDHDLVTFAESREKAFAKFVLGNGRCYETASMWSDTLGREIVPSDVVEIPAFIAKDWLMDSGDYDLNPVTLTLDRVGYVKMLVIPGTALRGWNTAFLKPDDAAFLLENYESSLGIAAPEPVEADEEDWMAEGILRMYSLPEPNEKGLIEVTFCFDDGENLSYDNPDHDPLGGAQ